MHRKVRTDSPEVYFRKDLILVKSSKLNCTHCTGSNCRDTKWVDKQRKLDSSKWLMHFKKESKCSKHHLDCLY